MNKFSILSIAIFILIVTVFLIHGFFNLMQGDNLPVDLAIRYWHVKRFIFEGKNIFLEEMHPLYPPSFFLFLSPILGFVSYQKASLVWALFNMVLLTGASAILYNLRPESSTKKEKLVLPLSFLSMHSIAMSLGVGQVSILIVSTLLFTIWLLEEEKPAFWKQTVASILLAISLNKYSLLIPFAIVFLFKRKTAIILVNSIVINVILSWYLLWGVDFSIGEFIVGLLQNSSYVNNLGSLDLQALVSFLRLPNSITYAGMIIFIGGLAWIIHRKKHLSWFDQLALAALTARFFMYHAHYDNVILVFVLIALWKRIPHFTSYHSSLLLFILTAISLIIPARFLDWNLFAGIGLIYQATIWIICFKYIITSENKFHTSFNELTNNYE